MLDYPRYPRTPVLHCAGFVRRGTDSEIPATIATMTDDLTPREVARELGVTVRTVQRWIADGRLPSSRVGSTGAGVAFVALERGGCAARCRTVPTDPTLLIANRGEIAVRVARTAHGAGDPRDRRPRARRARPDGTDESHEIGSTSTPSDPGGGAPLGRRRDPSGYGFLAENAAFAASVAAAGLAWVGPPAGGDRRHGRQGRRTAARGRTRRAGRAGLRRSGAGRRDPVRRGRAHRLSRCSSSRAPAVAARACAW